MNKSDINNNEWKFCKNMGGFIGDSICFMSTTEDEPIRWRFSILSMIQAVELALKAILHAEHEAFIYEDIYARGEMVSLLKAAERVSKVAHLTFTEKDIDEVKRIENIRTTLIYKDFEFDMKNIKPVFIRIFNFCNHIFSDMLEISLEELIPDETWEEIITMKNEVDSIYKELPKDKLWLLKCPLCGFAAFSDEGEGKCLLCGHHEEVFYCRNCGEPVFMSSDIFVSDGSSSVCQKCLKEGECRSQYLKLQELSTKLPRFVEQLKSKQ